MPRIAPERLYAAAKRLNLRWHCHASDATDCIIPFEDPQATYLEHVCHEVSHALLLGITPGPHLAKRVERALNRLGHQDETGEEGELNETRTFAVVMGALIRLGIPVDRSDMLEGNRVQVHYMDHPYKTIPIIWRAYEATHEYALFVATTAQVILDEVDRHEQAQQGPDREAQ